MTGEEENDTTVGNILTTGFPLGDERDINDSSDLSVQ